MTEVWIVALPTLAAVLAVAAVGKLLDPGSVDRAFRELRVPRWIAKPWIRRLFPVGELMLSLALVVTHGVAQFVALLLALALALVFLVLVARAASRPEPVACNCFGGTSERPVDGWTLLRNAVLVALATLLLVLWLLAGGAFPRWPVIAVERWPVVAAGAVVVLVLTTLGRNGDLTPPHAAPVPLTAGEPARVGGAGPAGGGGSNDDHSDDAARSSSSPV